MYTMRFLLLVTLLTLGCFAWGAGLTRAEVLTPGAPQTTIGTGTAASCQTNEASKAFEDAVFAGGVVDFNCGPEAVMITVNANQVYLPVTVNGNGRIILNGGDVRRIFYVMGTGSLTLNDILLFDGYANQGAGVYVEQQASLTLNRSSITSGLASGEGGAIYNRGTVVINDSTLGSNRANVHGGAIFNNAGSVTIRRSYLPSNEAQSGGAIFTYQGHVSIEQSAFRSNHVVFVGGAVYLGGPTTIVNTTFSNNRANSGGAIYLLDSADIVNNTFNANRADLGAAIWRQIGSTASAKNSIFAGSLDTAGNAPSLNCDGPALTSLGRNIVDDNTCVPNPSVTGDLLSTDPQLGPWLAPVLRGYIPQPGSPAIDYGLGCPPVDQRGLPRPLPAGGACDTGSIEVGGIVYLPLQMK